VLLVVVALLAGTLGAGLEAVLRGNQQSSPSAAISPRTATSGAGLAGGNAVTPVAAAVDPAVVDIHTYVANEVSAGAEQAAGTGMLITPSGDVLTNNHVVAYATRILVRVAGHGTYRGQVLGVDVTQDVALVKLVGAPANLPYVSFGNSAQVKVGTPVVAIGNALGLGGKPTVVSGTITAVGRTITASDVLATTATETLHNMLQTDAPIVAGDSGGPLVNIHDRVIGMDTAAQSTSATAGTEGFAIPINEARKIALQIENGRSSSRIQIGATGFLGIVTGESAPSTLIPFGFPTGVTGTAPAPAGVYVSGVVVGTGAEQAGIEAGDTITAIDGTPTTTNKALVAAIESHKPGASITVTFLDTSGASHTVVVNLTGIAR
jgi:S1-C subfamily serine protease